MWRFNFTYLTPFFPPFYSKYFWHFHLRIRRHFITLQLWLFTLFFTKYLTVFWHFYLRICHHFKSFYSRHFYKVFNCFLWHFHFTYPTPFCRVTTLFLRYFSQSIWLIYHILYTKRHFTTIRLQLFPPFHDLFPQISTKWRK